MLGPAAPTIFFFLLLRFERGLRFPNFELQGRKLVKRGARLDSVGLNRFHIRGS